MSAEHNDEVATLREEVRFWIEILSWDWNLAVALSSDLTPAEDRFQGGLSYVRGFDVWGRVAAPPSLSGKSVRIWISPFGRDMRFGPDDMDEVGRLYLVRAATHKSDWRASLLLPEDAIGPLATCLGTVSKYLFIRTFDARDGEASVDHYAFSSALPDNLTLG